MAADTGNGATLTRSGFTVDIVAIRIGEQTIDLLDISLLSTTGFMEKISADLADAGTFTVEYLYDSLDAALSLGGAAVSTVITWPLNAVTQSVAANITGTAIMNSHKYPDFENNVVQTATAIFTWDGVTGPTLTAAVAV
jgi:hypothetical protein